MSAFAGRPDPVQLGAYFDLIEIVSVLRHQVEQQLREEGGLSYVQFQLLARLGDSPNGSRRMTDLADGVVYSRSGLTYQAGLLEQAGLVTRTRAADDERGVTVTITDAGRAVLAAVLPGHVAVVGRLFYDAMPRPDLETLAGLLGPLRDHVRAQPARSTAPRAARRPRPGPRPGPGPGAAPPDGDPAPEPDAVA